MSRFLNPASILVISSLLSCYAITGCGSSSGNDGLFGGGASTAGAGGAAAGPVCAALASCCSTIVDATQRASCSSLEMSLAVGPSSEASCQTFLGEYAATGCTAAPLGQGGSAGSGQAGTSASAGQSASLGGANHGGSGGATGLGAGGGAHAGTTSQGGGAGHASGGAPGLGGASPGVGGMPSSVGGAPQGIGGASSVGGAPEGAGGGSTGEGGASSGPPTNCKQAHGFPGCCSADGTINYYWDATTKMVVSQNCTTTGQQCGWDATGNPPIYVCTTAKSSDPTNQYPYGCGLPAVPGACDAGTGGTGGSTSSGTGGSASPGTGGASPVGQGGGTSACDPTNCPMVNGDAGCCLDDGTCGDFFEGVFCVPDGSFAGAGGSG